MTTAVGGTGNPPCTSRSSDAALPPSWAGAAGEPAVNRTVAAVVADAAPVDTVTPGRWASR